MSATAAWPEPETAWPSVSVVVPTRDRPELLDRAVRSILAQRYPGSVECLVVFDQVEPSREPEGGDGRVVRVLRNDRTPGLAGARNTGTLAATGTLLAHCDDDDEWLPDNLRSQVEAMRRTGAPAAVCGHVLIYGRRRFVRLPPPEIRVSHLARSRTVVASMSSVVLRRDFVLDRVGLVDERVPGSYGEDYEFMLRLAGAGGGILGVRRPSVLKHWDRFSWFPDQWDTILSATRYILDKHPELRRDRRGLARLYGKMAFGLAARDRRSEALGMTRRSLALDWRQPRAYLALLVASGLVDAAHIQRAVRWLLGKRI